MRTASSGIPSWLKRTTLVRNLIPALIVALVLGSSFVVSAGAKDTNHDKDRQCGYGTSQNDNDESNNRGGDTSVQASDKNHEGGDKDKDCNEDESDGDGNGGGEGDGGGGSGGGDKGGDPGNRHPGGHRPE